MNSNNNNTNNIGPSVVRGVVDHELTRGRMHRLGERFPFWNLGVRGPWRALCLLSIPILY